MTVAEVQLVIQSKLRVAEAEEKKKASFDYILADLIGCSVARVHSKGNKMPTPAEAYPGIFDAEEEAQARQERQVALFAAQLKQFSNFHNDKLEGKK